MDYGAEQVSAMQESALDDRAYLVAKVDAIYESVEKTRKYFLWMLIATLVMVVLPLIGLVVAVPVFLSTYAGLSDSILLEGL